MAVNFQIPNQQGYLPSLPPQDNSFATVEQPSMPTNIDPLTAQLLNVLLHPPVPPAQVKPTRGQRIAMAFMTPENQTLSMQRLQESDPAYRQYLQQKSAFESAGKVLPALAGMQRQDMIQNRFESNQNRVRWQFGTLQFYDPKRGNVTLPVWRDQITQQIYDANRQNAIQIPSEGLSSPIHFTPYTGPGNETEFAPTSQMPGANAGVPQIVSPPTPPPPNPMVPRTGAAITPAPNTTTNRMQFGGGAANRLPPRQGPASVTTQYAAQGAFQQGLEELLSYHRQAHDAQVKASGQIDMSPGGLLNYGSQAGKELLSRSQFTQPLLNTMQAGPEVIGYRVRMLPKLFQYVKQQSGVQFGYREFMQYASLFPTSMDDEQTARTKIQSLVDAVRANRTELERQFHALAAAGPAVGAGGQNLVMSPEQFETMQEADPQAAQNFLADGGRIE